VTARRRRRRGAAARAPAARARIPPRKPFANVSQVADPAAGLAMSAAPPASEHATLAASVAAEAAEAHQRGSLAPADAPATAPVGRGAGSGGTQLLVVGAGLSGATVAREAAEAGKRVCVGGGAAAASPPPGGAGAHAPPRSLSSSLRRARAQAGHRQARAHGRQLLGLHRRRDGLPHGRVRPAFFPHGQRARVGVREPLFRVDAVGAPRRRARRCVAWRAAARPRPCAPRARPAPTRALPRRLQATRTCPCPSTSRR
jgi:hypothetical protein